MAKPHPQNVMSQSVWTANPIVVFFCFIFLSHLICAQGILPRHISTKKCQLFNKVLFYDLYCYCNRYFNSLTIS